MMKSKSKKKLFTRLHVLPRRWRRSSNVDENGVPRITNDSVAQHREEVLGRARKFIYPLKHSRNRVVKLSVGVVIIAILLFFIGSSLALYRFQSTSSFMYGVTRVVPFPVAWADGRFVSYESYLFELRHYMHYYRNQQDVDFNSDSGKRQLALLKSRSLEQAIDRAYVAKLASKNNVRVTNQEVNEQVDIAREQNRLGASEAVFNAVLRDFWGWTVTDFRHELKLELRDQKVAAALDTNTEKRAESAYQQLRKGVDFAKLASQVSDDAVTKNNGGEYGFIVTLNNRDLSPVLLQEIYKLGKNQYSPVINTGYTLEIVKVLKIDGTKRKVAHIAFNYKDISEFVNPIKKQHPPTAYISVK